MSEISWFDHVEAVGESYNKAFNGFHHRIFNAFPAGNYKVSVQAGESQYSSPREYRDSIRDYTQWEVAVIKEGEGLVRPPKSVEHYFEDGDTPVAGWMNFDQVQEIIQACIDEAEVETNGIH